MTKGFSCMMQGDMAEHAFILKHGVVTELVGEEVLALHRPSDIFGCEGVTAVRPVGS